MFLTSLLSRLTDSCNRCYLSKASPDYDSWVPEASLSSGIAPNLFQICLRGKNEDAETVYKSLPDNFKKNIAYLKENNPGWDYQLVSDKDAEDFILKYYGDVILRYYHKIDNVYGAARADFLRYLLLYEKGGVYLDLKSSVKESLSGLIDEKDRFFLFYWDNMVGGNRHCLVPDYIENGEMLQGFIICARRHPFLRSVIIQVMKAMDHYNPYTDGIGWAGVMNITGPVIYSKTIYYESCQESPARNLCFRQGRPFQDFGYQVNIYQDATPGTYQKNLSLKDYRKQSVPVIKGPNLLMNAINVLYLKILRMAHPSN